MQASVNADYVMTKLESFVRRQSLRSIAVELAKELQRDTEDSLEKAEELIAKSQAVNLKVFDPGLRMSDIDRVMAFLSESNHAFPTGIPEFDRRGFGPTRKEMFLYIADTKTGKTWCMIHLAKMVVMNGLRTVHVSLEMSEEKIAQRYVQTLFAISKRAEKYVTRRFKKTKRGKLDFEIKEVEAKLSLDNPNIAKKLKTKLKRWRTRILDNIQVKQFPTSQLTVEGLEAYLDSLEMTQGFVPDLLIVDYPDLMKIPGGAGQLRHGLSEVYKRLRGVAVARNLALAVPTQSNRGGATAKTVNRTNVSEAYSKIADADMALTYSQTELEKKLGLARLRVEAGRNDEDKITVVLSQNYAMGQYAVDSILMDKDYWDLIEAEEDLSGDDEYDPDDED
jgi:replicative DNA helicase